MYVSHVRDEGDRAFEAFRELIHIAEAAHIPANISHIKLATAPSWNKSGDVLRLLANARKRGLDITADVYPYTYWQSSITVLITSRDYDDRKAWEKGLADVGGADHVLLGCYMPDTSWAGKTVAQIAETTHQDPISVVEEIVHKTSGRQDGDQDSENVVVTAMTDSDVRAFVCDPHITFCSDGSMDDTHPRGAGTFPRVLGAYVREMHALPLEQAVHKMTGLSAQRMGFVDRGRIAPGMKADITLFNPWTVRDTATVDHPSAAPIGIPYVIVNGRIVLEEGKFTGVKPGMVLRHTRTATVGMATK
jgi:N-acyl-D-amino-acid deacylase